MTVFAMGFIFIMVFTVLVGIGAAIFISFDAEASQNPAEVAKLTSTGLYDIVRRVNTNTIETVDAAGMVQRWERSAK